MTKRQCSRFHAEHTTDRQIFGGYNDMRVELWEASNPERTDARPVQIPKTGENKGKFRPRLRYVWMVLVVD